MMSNELQAKVNATLLVLTAYCAVLAIVVLFASTTATLIVTSIAVTAFPTLIVMDIWRTK